LDDETDYWDKPAAMSMIGCGDNTVESTGRDSTPLRDAHSQGVSGRKTRGMDWIEDLTSEIREKQAACPEARLLPK